jgi:hypothetical protein
VPQNAGKSRSANENAKAVVATLLASGQTIVSAAAKAGVSERCVRKWLSQEEFKAKVEELRNEAVASAVRRLSVEMATAAATLADLMASRDPRVRLTASRSILEMGMKLKEFADLEQRLKDLEERLAGGLGR